jgi:hypothetical protein
VITSQQTVRTGLVMKIVHFVSNCIYSNLLSNTGYPLTPNVVIQNPNEGSTPEALLRLQRGREQALIDEPEKVVSLTFRPISRSLHAMEPDVCQSASSLMEFNTEASKQWKMGNQAVAVAAILSETYFTKISVVKKSSSP